MTEAIMRGGGGEGALERGGVICSEFESGVDRVDLF